MSDKKLVLITGVNGFIAAHAVEQLLERGYRVRGTLRGTNYEKFSKSTSVAGLEFVRIDDVATADFTEALEGVYAILHIACPLPGRKPLAETFNTAIEGTLNIVRQAQKAGVKKVVVTSSFGTLLHPSHMPAFAGLTFNETNWEGLVPEEEFEKNKDDKYYIYFTAKARAEQALWEFAKDHPEIEVATVLPGYVLGPYSKIFPLPRSVETLGTNEFIYQMITSGEVPFAPNWIADVRDVAKAHVLAVDVTVPADLKHKRFIANSTTYTWKQAAEHLKKVRPAVENRIVPLDEIKPLPGVLSTLDNTQTKKVLGFGEFIAPEKTFEDAVDDLLEAEKAWVKK